MSNRILIIGNGFVGARLARSLARAGHEVYVLSRSGHSPSGSAPIRADLRDAASLAAIPARVDYTFFTAGADEHSEEAYQQVYVDGLKNLVNAMGASYLFFSSSTAVYGQQDGNIVDETSTTEPTGFAGKILLEAEHITHKHGGTVVRFGGIYGRGRQHLLAQIFERKVGYANSDGQYTNRIHADDCAALLLHLMQLDQRANLYLGVDTEAADRRTLYTWLSDKLGVTLDEGKPARASQRAATNKRCSSARLQATGFSFAYPTFREGYAEMIADFLRERRKA